MTENPQIPVNPESVHGVISLLSAGDVRCDKCGKMIRHMERYCCNTHECPLDGAVFNSAEELNKHFSQAHGQMPARGARYCIEDSMKSGYLKIVKNKKTGEVFSAMFVLRDEEIQQQG